MEMNEADTRKKLIDPKIHNVGWKEDLIRREKSAGAIELINGKTKRKEGRADYLLCLPAKAEENPLAIAVLEAKKEDEHATLGLGQAKEYAKRLNVPFVFSTNGHLFTSFDTSIGKVTEELPLENFPTPDRLRSLYEKNKGFSTVNENSKALLIPYQGGQSERRYYQDAAIRATLEKVASQKKGWNRVLLSLATGSGKTRIAVQLLHKLEKAGQLKRALFVCDRNELKRQGYGSLFSIFGDNAVQFSKNSKWQNARLLVATYQSLGLDEEGDEGYFLKTFPKNYFSHIIIDECHRSAWNKWSLVLTNNPDAVQIGLTATPRKIIGEESKDKTRDEEISANNLKYFGEPVYEYPYIQGWEDGYLAACEIVRRKAGIDDDWISKEELIDREATDAKTGKLLRSHEIKELYGKESYDKKLILPDRRKAMCKDLLSQFEKTGGIKQKTIIFCANDKHAEDVANELNNLYAEMKLPKCDKFAFKFTAKTFDEGSDEKHEHMLSNMRDSKHSHFIATTVDLLSTGVDIPCIQNVVFFAYVSSPITFYQMVGRGTRIVEDEIYGKYMFRIYDYTNATRLFGKEFLSKVTKPKDTPSKPTTDEKEKIVKVKGFEVKIKDEGTFILMRDELTKKEKPITLEEYRRKLAESLVLKVENIDLLREMWVKPDERNHLIEALPGGLDGANLIRHLLNLDDCDLFDFLANVGFGVNPKTREQRVFAFNYKNKDWLMSLPSDSSKVVSALAKQFKENGIEELENPHVFEISEIKRAGGVKALAKVMIATKAILEVKRRLLVA
ncbi:MAG: restriction endonuclease subunit R [Candidatus Staskawiczbacteria bacterium]|nr:restriction endonuclease subunit R [Candidatus Staskawiczbacteria bacterium]